MVVKTKAIVLHSVKYSESQLIVDFFTEQLGRLSFMVRMSKSSKGKIKRQYFQPLALLYLEFEYHPMQTLQRLKEVEIAEPFFDIPFSPVKMSIAMFLSEVLFYATRHEQQNNALFLFLKNSVLWLDGALRNYSNFHIVFMIHLTLFLGFSPNMTNENGEEFFDLEEGRFVLYVPSHSNYLNQEDSLRIKDLLRLRYETMHLYTMSRVERNRCVEVILKYYKLHVPNFPELKSFSILQALFV